VNRLPHHVALLAALAACAPADKPWAAPLGAAAKVAATAMPAGVVPVPETSGDVEALRAEVARLQAENARLRLTPSVMAAQVRAAVEARDGRQAEAALQRLQDTFPYSAELGPASREVKALLATLRAADAEGKRVAALGFKALSARPVFSYQDTELRVFDTSVSRRWIFDSYGSGWSYLEPEKGQRWLTANVAVKSASKDPALFGLAAYAADGATLTQVGSFSYRFVRWIDFGAVLGNHADFRNDFGHTARIPFTVGAALSQQDARRRPLYLVVTREGCHRRRQDRLLQPPLHYVPESCASLKKTLKVEDFKDGSLAVLKRID
jgi:hypothetical protein